MRAGLMRHRITLQRPVRTEDDAGASEAGFVTLARVWAAIKTNDGSETVRADSQVAQVTHQFSLRHRTDVNAGCRIVWDSRTFEISAPPENVNERNRELRLMGSEVE